MGRGWYGSGWYTNGFYKNNKYNPKREGGVAMEGMVFKNKALVTAISPYNFTADDKREMSGVSMEFLMTENLSSCCDEQGEGKGYKIIKDSVAYDMKDNFTSVPGMYELSFKMVPAKNNKPQLRVVEASFIGEVQLVF
jgi:hypothetical protein